MKLINTVVVKAWAYRIITGIVLVLSVLLTSCSHDDLTVPKTEASIRTAADFIKNNYEFSLFGAALEYTGLATELAGKGPFTILAPTNQAFNESGVNQPGDLKKLNKDSLRFVLAYHILPRRLYSSDVPVNGVDVRYETLAGPSLFASLAMFNPGSTFPQNRFYFDGCQLISRDVPLSNGILHTINRLQKPFPNVTVQSWLAARAEYSMFVAALKKFGLWDELARPGRFTVFAPDNKAFESIGITADFITALDPSQYIGERLFGTYIIYDRQYFISDKRVFEIINNESFYTYKLRNDRAVLSLSAYDAFGVNSGKLYYTLQTSITTPRPEVLGSVTSTEETWVKMDNLCDNGIVHNLPGILVLPDQAKK